MLACRAVLMCLLNVAVNPGLLVYSRGVEDSTTGHVRGIRVTCSQPSDWNEVGCIMMKGRDPSTKENHNISDWCYDNGVGVPKLFNNNLGLTVILAHRGKRMTEVMFLDCPPASSSSDKGYVFLNISQIDFYCTHVVIKNGIPVPHNQSANVSEVSFLPWICPGNAVHQPAANMQKDEPGLDIQTGNTLIASVCVLSVALVVMTLICLVLYCRSKHHRQPLSPDMQLESVSPEQGKLTALFSNDPDFDGQV